ncbi:uncharacterized protein RSE6_04916 [Rhynchosporium secalis]|uniref:Uncharacterized protein n=1 Tax=Rhynchosporium secalis TaxID=38038 RepID=A0A1E1M6H0_RHYSE|nr:uncharacterized protein RSE6_04916 [Rhynchosporium secalis]
MHAALCQSMSAYYYDFEVDLYGALYLAGKESSIHAGGGGGGVEKESLTCNTSFG